MNSKHPLLSRLEERAKERPGKVVDFPIEIKSKNIQVAMKVWIQPLYADESDLCKVKASDYCDGRFSKDDESSIIDAQNVEALVYGYRDADNHDDKIFTNAQEIRSTMTNDEIALLVHQLNMVTYGLSSWKITEDKHASLELAKELSKTNDVGLIELMHSTELSRLVMDVAKELDKVKKENEALKKKIKE